jgi:hypothetical protein
MISWQNDKLTKWRVDKMTSWQNVKLTKWQFYKMTILQNDNFTKWQFYKMTILQNDNFTKWQSYKMTILLNDNFTKWQFYKMITKWQDVHIHIFIGKLKNVEMRISQVDKMTGRPNVKLTKWHSAKNLCCSKQSDSLSAFLKKVTIIVIIKPDNFYLLTPSVTPTFADRSKIVRLLLSATSFYNCFSPGPSIRKLFLSVSYGFL